MRKILLSTFLITLQLSAWANPIDDNCPQHTTLGAPVSSIKENTQYICHMFHVEIPQQDDRPCAL